MALYLSTHNCIPTVSNSFCSIRFKKNGVHYYMSDVLTHNYHYYRCCYKYTLLLPLPLLAMRPQLLSQQLPSFTPLPLVSQTL